MRPIMTAKEALIILDRLLDHQALTQIQLFVFDRDFLKIPNATTWNLGQLLGLSGHSSLIPLFIGLFFFGYFIKREMNRGC